MKVPVHFLDCTRRLVTAPSPLVGEGITKRRPTLIRVRGNVSTIAKAPSPASRLTPLGTLSHKGRGEEAASALIKRQKQLSGAAS